MKRIVALLLSFLLAFGGIPVYAEENAVALSKSEIEAGGEVTLTFTYPQTVGNILYAEAKVLYDAENFVLKSGPSGWTTDDSNGVAAANYLPSDVEAGEDFSEKSVKFVFTANSSAKAGSYEFTVSYQAVDTNTDIHEANGIKATLNIKTAEVAVESVSLDKTAISLEEGATETLSATVLLENATDKTVTWESSNKEVATVEEGVVTAVKAGSATITAKSGEKEATCEVTVTAKVVSEPFSYTISDIPSNGDNWAKLDSLVISGEAGKVIGHSWNGFSLIVLLDKSTPDDAVINSKANTSGMRPTLSGAGDITLENGTAKQSLKLSSPFGDICKVDILYTKDNAPVIADGKDSEITAVIAFGESYEADVSNIFTDEDGDELSYQVKVDDGAYENFGGSKYIYKSEVAGEHVLTFLAYDGVLYSEGTYTVKLKIENSKTTYDVNVTVPDGISPKFYAVNTVKNGAVVKGDELAFENGKVKVPENITRIMWEADGFAGMSASVSAGANLELVKTEFEAQDYFGKADTAATIEITDPEGVKISGKTADKYLLPAVSGFTYKVTAGVSGYSPVELTEQTPTSGKVEIKLVLIHFSVIAPKGSVVSAGILTGSFKYSFIEPIVVETEGETVIYKFAPLSNPSSGGAFIRVQHPDDPDAVTYWDWKSSKADKQTITVTEEMLFMNDNGDDKFDSDTVYRNFEKFAMDLGDIYMNINNQGYININVGDSKGLNMFRNWQAIESFTNARISLPDFKYEIITLEGNDVISITPDKYNSAAATLTAKGEGTAIVLVTYDAMYSDSTVANSNGDAGGGNRYTAIWPDRTGVFVVSVGKDGTAIKSNMTCNGAVFDAEHSPQFYIGNEGAKVSFTPDEGVTVTVNRSTVGKETLSFGGFTSEGVSVNAGTGEVTVSGLKTGRHIIKFEKDGVASYQVVTAQQVTVDIVRSDGTELGLNSTIAPGTALTLKIKGLTNPAEKFATKYNFNAQVTYKDEKGNTYKNSSGAAFGKYDFSSLEQIVNVTVPSDWEGETITLNGYIQMGGFAGGAIGDHRKVSYGTSSGMATGSGAGMVLGTLPELVLNIGSVHATSISLDKTEVRAEADEPFALTATVLPENSTDVVEWISADETIATVKDGVVTGQSAGKTAITAKVGDLTAVCTVEVYGTKKEIDVETNRTANKYYFTDVKIKGVRGAVEKSEGTTHTILLDPRTKTTDTLDFVMTANRTNSSRYFWVNNNKLQTSAGNPGTISIVPDWNENNEAVVTIRIANSGGGSNYDGPHTLNLKIAPHDHDSKNEVADAKYLKSEATCTEKAVYWKSCSVCGLASDSEYFKFGEALGHTFDREIAEEKYLASEATCTEAATYYMSCLCGANGTATFSNGEALGHDWGKAEYKWSEDALSCTATRVCKNDAVHTESAEAEVTGVKTKEPTCAAMGDTQYTAKFSVDWAETQVTVRSDVEIDPDAHDWGAWNVTKLPDYGEEGLRERECNNQCENKIQTEEIAALEMPEQEEMDKVVVDGKEYYVDENNSVDEVIKEELENAVKNDKDSKLDKKNRKVSFVGVIVGEFDDAGEFSNARATVTIEFPEGADKNDKFEVYVIDAQGNVTKLAKANVTKDGIEVEVDGSAAFAVAYESVANTSGKPSKPSSGSGITIIDGRDEAKEESNPNTGAPIVCSFDLTAAGVVVLAATTAVLKIKRRK